MELKLKIDLTNALNNDSDEFNGFTLPDYESYAMELLQRKLDDIELECGIIIEIL